jgi:hypothetical protein
VPRLIAAYTEVGDGLATVGEPHRHVDRHPARIFTIGKSVVTAVERRSTSTPRAALSASACHPGTA